MYVNCPVAVSICALLKKASLVYSVVDKYYRMLGSMTNCGKYLTDFSQTWCRTCLLNKWNILCPIWLIFIVWNRNPKVENKFSDQRHAITIWQPCAHYIRHHSYIYIYIYTYILWYMVLLITSVSRHRRLRGKWDTNMYPPRCLSFKTYKYTHK